MPTDGDSATDIALRPQPLPLVPRGEGRIRLRSGHGPAASAGAPSGSLRLATSPKTAGGGWGCRQMGTRRRTSRCAYSPSPTRSSREGRIRSPCRRRGSRHPPPRSLREGPGREALTIRTDSSEAHQRRPHIPTSPSSFGGGGRVMRARRGRPRLPRSRSPRLHPSTSAPSPHGPAAFRRASQSTSGASRMALWTASATARRRGACFWFSAVGFTRVVRRMTNRPRSGSIHSDVPV